MDSDLGIHLLPTKSWLAATFKDCKSNTSKRRQKAIVLPNVDFGWYIWEFKSMWLPFNMAILHCWYSLAFFHWKSSCLPNDHNFATVFDSIVMGSTVAIPKVMLKWTIYFLKHFPWIYKLIMPLLEKLAPLFDLWGCSKDYPYGLVKPRFPISHFKGVSQIESCHLHVHNFEVS